ncbi:hypothetical protein IscW_ISCW008531 [Ixodes scapularis]|uniref:Protein masquerade clip-domain domain-containing protein n=1 Tax=Ixodes scapularis TaxID=6945 RepID=B7Q1S3_IXOSC|nr:hypothetical protein IscW_ISCW008531 [Ixodes scapularis]|eukprot:XP_002410068.1 hypothetical protein IscW_ISCW008531 [Ixodes scapularis]
MLRSDSARLFCFVACISVVVVAGDKLEYDKCYGKCISSVHSESSCNAELIPDVCGSADFVCCPQLELKVTANRLNAGMDLPTSSKTGLTRTYFSVLKRPRRDTYFSLLRSVVSEAFHASRTTEKKPHIPLQQNKEILTPPTTAAYAYSGTTLPARSATQKSGTSRFQDIFTMRVPELDSSPSIENKKPATRATTGDGSSQTVTPTAVNRQATMKVTPASTLQSSDLPSITFTLGSLTTTTPETTTEHFSYPCPGSCVASFLAWFCDLQSAEYQCPNERVCCMPLTTTTTQVPPVGPCPGTCLHPQLTGLCRRPARLLLKTTTCDSHSICCTETPRIW